jgi:hypothetical protein
MSANLLRKLICVSCLVYPIFSLAAAAPTSTEGKTKADDRSEADFCLIETSPKEPWLDVPGELPVGFPSKRIQVRIANDRWLLPVYFVKELRIPERPGPDAPVVLQLSDALYHPEYQAAVKGAMDAFLKGSWKAGMPIGNQVLVTLFTEIDGEQVELAAGKFTRGPGRPEPTVKLRVHAGSAETLAKIDPKDLGLAFREVYRGRFRSVDLEATVTISGEAGVAFQNMLGTDTNGQRATMLMAVGGGVEQKFAAQQMFRRRVAVAVMKREGREVNEALLDKVIERLFSGLQEEVKWGQLKDDQAVTFLLGQGLKATASIGSIKGLKSQSKQERDRLFEQEKERFVKHKLKLGGDTSFGMFQMFDGKLKLDYEKEEEDKKHDRHKEQTHALDEMMKHIEADLPVAVLNAKQLQTLATRSESELKFDMGTFADGRKTLLSVQFLAGPLAARAKPRTEAERRRDAEVKLVQAIEAVRARLALFLAERDRLAGENKPHEERLDCLGKQVAAARADISLAQQALDAANVKVESRLREIMLNKLFQQRQIEALFTTEQRRLIAEAERHSAEEDCGVPGLRAAVAESQKRCAEWEAACAAHEKNLLPMRAKLAKADQAISETRSTIAALEVELAALRRLIAQDQPQHR